MGRLLSFRNANSANIPLVIGIYYCITIQWRKKVVHAYLVWTTTTIYIKAVCCSLAVIFNAVVFDRAITNITSLRRLFFASCKAGRDSQQYQYSFHIGDVCNTKVA